MTDFTNLLSQAKQMQEKMKEAQESLKKIEAEGVSGGDKVKVIMNGDGELKKIFIDDSISLVDFKILENKYLSRKPYFFMKATAIIDILTVMEAEGKLSTFNILDHIDDKLEEDDPILIVKTDYTPF